MAFSRTRHLASILVLAIGGALLGGACGGIDSDEALARCARARAACGGELLVANICRDTDGCRLNGKRLHCVNQCRFPPKATLTVDLRKGIVPARFKTLVVVPIVTERRRPPLDDFDVTLDGVPAVANGGAELVFPEHEGPFGILEITSKLRDPEPVGVNVILEDGPCLDAAASDPNLCPADI